MTVLDQDVLLRPDDHELVKATGARLRRATSVPLVFGGLRQGGAIPMTVTLGHQTSDLRTIDVRPRRGLGGRTLLSRKPSVVRDYGSSREITHDFDRQILGERIVDLAVAPFVVRGVVRGLLYAGSRDPGRLTREVVTALAEEAQRISDELTIRDEVDRRLSAIDARWSQQDCPTKAGVEYEERRELLAEMRVIAARSEDPDTRRRLGELIKKQLQSQDAPYVELTRRHVDVLALVSLGCSNHDIANRLGLSSDTIKTYLRAAMSRLGARTRHEAVVRARRAGYLL
jgi:DNA-binding NarL/FixJ family response regulator